VDHLLEADWCRKVIALDRPGSGRTLTHPKFKQKHADLSDPADARWREALAEAEGVVHLAARNPNPDCSWDDAAVSFDMTCRIAGAAAEAGVRRLVFASSNHVMGRYKDPPLADGLTPGALTTAITPGPGTRWFNGTATVDGVAYASSKLMGERLCSEEAALSGGALTAVSTRIGWCQPGDNDPTTINSTGVAGAASVPGADAERNLLWFRQMWLSNRDFLNLMEQALRADAAAWPSPGIVVNGMSANEGMAWDIEATRRLIGYAPKDDVWDRVEA
jgi:nucleoside-diphosphate-sugar epimerase